MSRPSVGALVLAAVLAAVLGATAACGVPRDPTPRDVTPVPYDLLSPGDGAVPRPSVTASRRPFIYLAHDDDRLTPVAADAISSGGADAVNQVLARLASGPTVEERSQGLSTALGPEPSMSLLRLEGDRADIEVDLGAQQPSAARLPLAVGQVVLSVTSVPGISRVALIRGGHPIEAPLPGGALTNRPLTAADYRALVSPLRTTSG